MAFQVDSIRNTTINTPVQKVILHLFLLLLLSFSPPAELFALEWEPADEGAPGLHAQCWSFGASAGRVEGMGSDLNNLGGPEDGVIILELTQNDYLTPYTSREYQITLSLLNDFTILQGAFGYRFSTVPFPKAFLRPWVGAYLTFNLLEDDRDFNAGNDEFDGAGVGMAAALGVTMMLSRNVALEAAAKGDQVFTLGWLENDRFFAEEFRVRGGYLRLIWLLK